MEDNKQEDLQKKLDDAQQNFNVQQGRFKAREQELKDEKAQSQKENEALKSQLEQVKQNQSNTQDKVIADSRNLLNEELGVDTVSAFNDLIDERARKMQTDFDNRINEINNQANNQTNTGIETAQEAFNYAISAQVPNWEDIDNSDEFILWTKELDGYSGRPRLEGYQRAYQEKDLQSFISYLKGYLKDKGLLQDSLESQVNPKTTSGTQPAKQGKIYKQSEIDAKMLEANKNPALYSTPEFQQFSKEVELALSEGRVVP